LLCVADHNFHHPPRRCCSRRVSDTELPLAVAKLLAYGPIFCSLHLRTGLLLMHQVHPVHPPGRRSQDSGVVVG
jgi:hypothetical protein